MLLINEAVCYCPEWGEKIILMSLDFTVRKPSLLGISKLLPGTGHFPQSLGAMTGPAAEDSEDRKATKVLVATGNVEWRCELTSS